jgi:hypothetical protein
MANDALAYDGAPTIDPCLSDKQLEQIQKIVEEAPSAPLRGALETTIEESADAVSVEVFRRAIAQHAGVPCQITYAEGDEGTVGCMQLPRMPSFRFCTWLGINRLKSHG